MLKDLKKSQTKYDCDLLGLGESLKKHFIDYKQFLEDEDSYNEKLKTYTGEAAQKEYDKWRLILNNSNQGSFAKQFFYYGAYKQEKDGSFKTCSL